MDNRKVILMIIPGLGQGGAERIYHYMSKAFAEDYRVVEVFFNLDDQVYPIVNKEYYVLNPVRARGIFQKFRNLYHRVAELRRIKKAVKPDFSISQMDGADYINILTRIKTEKVITCIQCTLVNDNSIKGLIGWIRKHIFIRFFYRWPDAIVPVSQEIQKELEDFCGTPSHKFKTIYNFADIAKVHEQMDEPVVPALDKVLSENFSLVTSGRMEEQKNQRFLLQAFKRFVDRKPGVTLFILGDGQLRVPLTAYARTLGLKAYSAADSDNPEGQYDVYFMGFQKNPFKYFSRADWFVFTSLWEGLPLVLVESIACGTPIISTDCKTGPKEILSFNQDPVSIGTAPRYADYGILMPPSDSEPLEQHIELWADALTKLESDATVGAHYRTKQQERLGMFSLEYAVQSWKDLFATLKK